MNTHVLTMMDIVNQEPMAGFKNKEKMKRQILEELEKEKRKWIYIT